eukprot:TRINITY_DN2917_c0_g4_i1.p1 TRINITY_DN2917_c0_g4~~TRINITY_DN2917_c0_g4_i1.p1  ORF type:complete len:584 (-),score=60.85 TRINITY_DN2917_c0_g4_i1:210-1823(-)
MASGHINPSLPIARTFVDLGHQVHYLCREQMREAIEDTGATFHAEVDELSELYEGREPFLIGAMLDLQKEYGLEGEDMIRAHSKLNEIQLEMMLPGTVRWLRQVKADVVVCCPIINNAAVYAAEFLGVPCVSLLTTAGPGSCEAFMRDFLNHSGRTPEELVKGRMEFQPLRDCMVRLRKDYNLTLAFDEGLRPLGLQPTIIHSTLTLVTTGAFLQDPVSPELAQIYKDANSKIVFVGPLLDKEGARRAAGHKFEHTNVQHETPVTGFRQRDPVMELREAKSFGRTVVYVSMGTVITGDHNEWGWNGRVLVDGQPKGLSGKELCQSAWRGAFDTFGSQSAGEGPLLLVALGPQSDALEGLETPPNALCLPVMPQVDILNAGVDVFLTHGGQNSFMEALAVGVPVVVCPGFGDQPVNARKADSIGVGKYVERPMPELEHVDQAMEAYRHSTAAALQNVLEDPTFKAAAQYCAESLIGAGGVPRAAQLILECVSHARQIRSASGASRSLPNLLGQRGTDAGDQVRKTYATSNVTTTVACR